MAGRKPADFRPHRRTREQAVEERSHIARRSTPGHGTRAHGSGITAYVAFDPETFAQVRSRAASTKTGFSGQIRSLTVDGLRSLGVEMPKLAAAPSVRRPAVGATRRNDKLPFSAVSFPPDVFEIVRRRALDEGTSFAEQVRQLVEWGLEE